ncbi:PWWP domain-containing DNA repair factor 3A-like [Cavia porcellus]|uniref:PWWP domain-containing DNA repair factor 3A-like n=1 Tax=Cavia porcellus TaxID=10141 RepID=UPI002FE27226
MGSTDIPVSVTTTTNHSCLREAGTLPRDSDRREAKSNCSSIISGQVNHNKLEDLEDDRAWLCIYLSPDAEGPYNWMLPEGTPATQAGDDHVNQKIVDFIVKTKGTDSHLLDIMQGRKPSCWLEAFLEKHRHQVCMETYMEDNDQLRLMAQHLQHLYESTAEPILALRAVDKVKLVMEVLLPEAVICSIATLEGLDYQGAEERFLHGPYLCPLEKELLDRNISRKRKRSRASKEPLCTPPKSASTP